MKADGTQAKTTLEQLTEDADVSDSTLFNLATTYELCTSDPSEAKAALAARTASLVSSGTNRQRMNADFKI